MELEELQAQGPSTLRDYLQILSRSKWIILQAVVIVPIAAVLWTRQSATVYTASAGVLMQTANLGANITGVQDPTQMNPQRIIQTQIPVARLPVVADRTVRAAGPENWSASDLLGESTVTSAPESSDILNFSVTDAVASRAMKLANEYARQFTRYRRELDSAAIANARAAVVRRIEALEAAGRQRSPLFDSLVATKQRLSTLEALQTSRAILVRPATGAAKLGPAVKKNAVFGVVLGALLGIGLAFLRNGLDMRVRSADIVGRALDLHLLGRIVQPPRRLRRRKRLVTLAKPFGVGSEAFRMLAPNIHFANSDLHARLIMVTSAVEREGKSTTAANLAVTFARGGARVLLVDLDPYGSPLDDFFDLSDREPHLGLADVILGRAPLEAAFREIDVGTGVGRAPARISPTFEMSTFANRQPPSPLGRGRLDVLRWGDGPPQALAGVGRDGKMAPAAVFERMKAHADLVLLDAPPLLRTADALNASSYVDALLVVVRLNFIRRDTLADLRRVLDSVPRPKLGFIATGADGDTGHSYSSYSYFDRQVPDRWRSKLATYDAHEREGLEHKHGEHGPRS